MNIFEKIVVVFFGGKLDFQFNTHFWDNQEMNIQRKELLLSWIFNFIQFQLWGSSVSSCLWLQILQNILGLFRVSLNLRSLKRVLWFIVC